MEKSRNLNTCPHDIEEGEIEEDEMNFEVRPPLNARFKRETVKEIIHSVLSDTLAGKSFNSTLVPSWCDSIASNIQRKVKDIVYKKYKLVVHVMLGEEGIAGVKITCRCFWDSESDTYISNVFRSESIFCVATVYAIYSY